MEFAVSAILDLALQVVINLVILGMELVLHVFVYILVSLFQLLVLLGTGTSTTLIVLQFGSLFSSPSLLFAPSVWRLSP
jgi:hypothetical protein